MKRLNLLSGILMAIAMTLSFSACSDNNDPAPTPDPDPQPELSDYHFDIFMTIGKHGGMNQGDGYHCKKCKQPYGRYGSH